MSSSQLALYLYASKLDAFNALIVYCSMGFQMSGAYKGQPKWNIHNIQFIFQYD